MYYIMDYIILCVFYCFCSIVLYVFLLCCVVCRFTLANKPLIMYNYLAEGFSDMLNFCIVNKVVVYYLNSILDERRSLINIIIIKAYRSNLIIIFFNLLTTKILILYVIFKSQMLNIRYYS